MRTIFTPIDQEMAKHRLAVLCGPEAAESAPDYLLQDVQQRMIFTRQRTLACMANTVLPVIGLGIVLGGIVPAVFNTPHGFKEAALYGCTGLAALLAAMAPIVTKENERMAIRISWRAHRETQAFMRDRLRSR